MGLERIKLNGTVIDNTIEALRNAMPSWIELIDSSFLNQDLKDDYKALLEKRIQLVEL